MLTVIIIDDFRNSIMPIVNKPKSITTYRSKHKTQTKDGNVSNDCKKARILRIIVSNERSPIKAEKVTRLTHFLSFLLFNAQTRLYLSLNFFHVVFVKLNCLNKAVNISQIETGTFRIGKIIDALIFFVPFPFAPI